MGWESTNVTGNWNGSGTGPVARSHHRANPGRKIHAGTRHYAVLPLSFAVKPLKYAESARHDLLPCPDCQNLSK